MPPRVTWNLLYPTRTPDQVNRFRHHYETLRADRNVSEVEVAERADHPHLMTMRVEFRDGAERPDSQELRFADLCYPNDVRLVRNIEVPALDVTVEQAQEFVRQIGNSIAAIGVPVRVGHLDAVDRRGRDLGLATRTVSQAMERFAEIVQAIRLPDFEGMVQAAGQGAGGVTPPPAIPKWVVAGTTYRRKKLTGQLEFDRMRDHPVDEIATLKRIVRAPTAILIELAGDNGISSACPLADFVELYEPYVRNARRRTAWDKLLENIDVEDD